MISIAGRAWDAHHDLFRNDKWTLLVDGDVVCARDSIFGIGKSSDQALFVSNLLVGKSLSGISVDAGDIVRFEVEATTGYGHFTGVDMQVNYEPSGPVIPEPATMLSGFLSVGALGAIRAYRRRRASKTTKPMGAEVA